MNEIILTPQQERDLNNASMLMKECLDLMQSRNVKYWSSWKVLTIQSIANLCEMKLNRIAKMTNEKLDPKIEDEFMDTVNYCIFALMKFKNL